MSDTFKAGDAVFVFYGETKVGHVLSEEQARRVNEGEPIVNTMQDKVEHVDGVIHYYSDFTNGPECQPLDYNGLSWSIFDTTCEHCLYFRAKELRGWRWIHDYNEKEVAFLKEKLGDKVKGFEKCD